MRILVAGPPKTGNVWIDQLLSNVYGLEWLHEPPPPADAEFPGWARTSFPDDSIVHQHYWPTEGVLAICDELAVDLVTTIRNPYDQFVSLYFYAQRFSMNFRDTASPAREVVGRTIDDPAVIDYLRNGFRRNLEIGTAWLESGRSQIVRYEDLHRAPEDTLLALSEVLGPVDLETVRTALADAQPDRMRTMNKHVHAHIRSAQAGDWRNHLTNAHLEAMAEHADLVEELGYEVERPRRSARATRFGETLRRRAHRRSAKPFLIVSVAQTGATHLRYLLDSHPGIRCYGELFDPDDAYYATSGLTDHHQYLAELDPSEARSIIGFELSWSSIRSFPQVLDLLHDPRRRVVRVGRQNLLARFVAAVLPSYGSYRHDGDTEARSVRIDPDHCLQTMHEWFVTERILDELLRHSRTLDVDHDDLDDSATRDSIERFLGVSPAPLASPLERMPAKPLPEVVENWDEVEALLRGTVWERFLDD